MPRIDLAALVPRLGSAYPPPHDAAVAQRRVRSLSTPAGLTDLAAEHVELPAGTLSSQRHWHEGEDEFVVVVSGTATLIDDAGETAIATGDCLAFPKGDGNGHHLRAGPEGCTMIAISRPGASPVHYPDIDMLWDDRTDRFYRRDGTPYPGSAS